MIAALWPWLAVAGLGILHGLSPASGWMFATACGVRAGDGARTRQALLPIAIGHAASVALAVSAVAQGILVDRALVQGLAGALLVGVAACRLLRGAGSGTPIRAARHAPTGSLAGHAGLAFWSCLMSIAHGAGLMLVPALVPLCMAAAPSREITASGSLLLALAAVGVHMAAMLLTTGVIATGVYRGIAMHPRRLHGTAARHAWTAALALTGALLLVPR